MKKVTGIAEAWMGNDCPVCGAASGVPCFGLDGKIHGFRTAPETFPAFAAQMNALGEIIEQHGGDRPALIVRAKLRGRSTWHTLALRFVWSLRSRKQDHERWLWKNKEARKSVMRGIQQARDGQIVDMESYAQYADD